MTQIAACTCGRTTITLIGGPIGSVVCYCHSCRTAAQGFERTPGAPPVVTPDGGVAYCLFRKDRVALTRGAEHLAEHRLTPQSPTRRMVAGCCGTPMFTDFTPGHWLALFHGRLDDAPAPRIGIMAGDRPKGTPPDGITLYRTFAPRLMIALLLAWAAMGFRRPKIDCQAT
jgi:hypothetical protein